MMTFSNQDKYEPDFFKITSSDFNYAKVNTNTAIKNDRYQG